MSGIDIPKDDSLAKLQAYIKAVGVARGFEDESVTNKMMLLTEELGELARAIRKDHGALMSDDTKRSNIEDEAADVLIVLLDVCNKLGIILSKSFVAKEKKNAQRTWK